MIKLGRMSLMLGLVWTLLCLSCFAKVGAEDVLGPWREGDFAASETPADNLPDGKSRELVRVHYECLVKEVFFIGENKAFGFRIAPRNERWMGLLITTPDGKPLPAPKRDLGKYKIRIINPDSPDPAQPETTPFHYYRDKAVFSDASRYFRPRTKIQVLQGDKLLDQVLVDFSSVRFKDSRIQLTDLQEPDTQKGGFVKPDGSDFRRADGKRMFFWGGHENHIPSKEQSDLYAEAYRAAGINVMRHLGHSGMVKNTETGEIDPEWLDRFHYLVYRLGQHGIYFMMSHTYGYVAEKTPARGGIYGYAKGMIPNIDAGLLTFTDPKLRSVQKKFWKELLTTVNPYTGKPLKDDPTVIGFELANEHGLGPRKFDCNRVDHPEATAAWCRQFNEFLLKKYGTRDRLAEAWQANPLFPHEDPAANTILIPTNFRGARHPYGGTGQHDQYTIGKFYKNGLPAEFNPRIRDAIEFNRTVAKKSFPFDFNNLTTLAENTRLRTAWNAFLLKKYGDRKALGKAWAEDPLFSWEDPAKDTILIPSNYRGEPIYVADGTNRRSDPRIGDAKEMMYEIQKAWATDLVTFLRDEVGMQVAIGWNGDGFQVVQEPNHLANLHSPCTLCIAAGYCDWDNGDQLTSRTKNLKRWTTYSYIYGRPSFAYEWGGWSTMGPYQHEYILQAALFGRIYGFDGFANHKMAAIVYPVANPHYSLKVHYITPISERPRRGAFCIARWVLERSTLPEICDRVLVGYPKQSVLTGGPERRMSNFCFENWINYQIGTESYGFDEVYDGPADRIIIHEGRGPYGDYRKAKHAILWCHSNFDREGKDLKAKEKWFALHGIVFQPGQKYYLDDHYFATTEDMTEYVKVHAKAEAVRWDLLRKTAEATKKGKTFGKQSYESRVTSAGGDYWAAEPEAQPTELDRQLYGALKRWGYSLPFAENEIDKVWRSRDRTVEMDTTRLNLKVDRTDMQIWFGRAGKGTRVCLSRLEAETDEHQYAVALLAWDTADFVNAKSLALWCMWNSQVTVKLPFPQKPEVYAVNWLGKRLFKVKPTAEDEERITFMTARHDDIFCYEIAR